MIIAKVKAFLLALVLPSLFLHHVQAQENKHLAWFYYAGHYDVAKKWSIRTLYLQDWEDVIDHLEFSILRVEGEYQVSNNVSLTLGLERLRLLSINEVNHGVYEQITFKRIIPSLPLSLRARLENRIINGELNNRFRVRILNKFPLFNRNNKNSLKIVLQNEVFLNAHNPAELTLISQNRFTAALEIRLSKVLQTQIGYMNQKLNNGINHVAIIGLAHRIKR